MPRPTATFAAAIVVAAYAVVLALAFGKGPQGWLVDGKGAAQLTDYISLWSAGRLAVDGRPADAYDWVLHAKAMSDALGRPQGPFPFAYPPTFLLVMQALAMVPYVASMLGFVTATLVLYAGVGARIVGGWHGAIWIAAAPTVLLNFYAGQNGFLTAALLGAGIAALNRSQLLAGVLLGCLSIKPHLCLLVPLALAAGGYWRAMAAAGVTALALALSAWAFYGGEVWLAFAGSLSRFGTLAASTGYVMPFKLQTAFGMLVTLGVPRPAAFVVHAVLLLMVAGVVVEAWRRALPFSLKAAALVTATLLASPYLFIYDLTLQGVAGAFLLRYWLENEVDFQRVAALALACSISLLFFPTKLPMGFAGSLILLALVLVELAPFAWPRQRATAPAPA